MMERKMNQTLTEKYGKPIGCEFVFDNAIIRRSIYETNNLSLTSTPNNFSIVAQFATRKEADQVFAEWMDENNLPVHTWNYTRPITGWDENGLTFTDSWGEKK